MNIRFLLLATLLTIGTMSISQSTYSRVKFDLSKTDIKELTELGLETDHGFFVPGVHFINDFSSEELQRVSDSQLEFKILIPDLDQHYKNRKSEKSIRNEVSCNDDDSGLYNYMTPSNYTYGSMGGYHTYTEMLEVLDSMHSKYPDLISIKTPVVDIKTWDENEIYWLRISDNPTTDEDDEPEVLYTALHHAREPNGLSQMIFYMWYLLENYETNPEVKYLVDNTELYFMPCVNPDGYQYNEATNPDGGGFWRKNRRPAENGGGVGVDLNRNYDFFWGNDDVGSSPNSNSDTYRGPEGFSEPETQAVRDFTIDHNILIALNYHTFGNLLIHPWGYNDLPTDEDSIFKAVGQSMIKENNFTLGTGTETVGYTVNGDSDDYMYGEEGEKSKIYSMTPEVGSSFWPDSSSIDGFNKSCMHQNLSAAHSLLNYYDARLEVPALLEEDEGTFPLKVFKSGFGDGSATVEIISNSEYLIFDQFLMFYDLDISEREQMDVTFNIAGNAPPLIDLSFDVRVDNGKIQLSDTYTFTYRRSESQELYNNDISDLTTLINPGEWRLTESEFVSEPTSITDSPNGGYDSNVENILIITDNLDLTDVSSSSLKFSAKWLIEANYDYVLTQVSTDGDSWTSLCGNYTNMGSANTHGTSDPLLDGQQTNWVVEEMPLDDYVGQVVQLRMVLISDSYVELDGIYVDDIIVESNELIISSTEDIDPNLLILYPSLNDGRFVIELGDEINISDKAYIEIISTDGQRVSLLNELKQVNTIEGLSQGIYVVTYYDGDKSISKRVSVIR